MNLNKIEEYSKIIRSNWEYIIKDITKNGETIPFIDDIVEAYESINKILLVSSNGIDLLEFYSMFTKNLICIMCSNNKKPYDQIYLIKELIEQVIKGYIHRIYLGSQICLVFNGIEKGISTTSLDKYFERTLSTKIFNKDVQFGLLTLRHINDTTDFDNIDANSDIQYYGLDVILNNIFNEIFRKLYVGESDIINTLTVRYECKLPDYIDVSDFISL